MSFWQTLTGRLFKLVFGWYLALAISVTTIQLVLEYSSIKSDITSNLDSLGQSFSPSVADALWVFDKVQLDAMAKGIAQATFVTGVRIEPAQGEPLAEAGAIPDGEPAQQDGLLAAYQVKRFPLVIKTPRGEERTIGQLVLYSARSVAVERVKYSFIVILINSLIKTTGLWLIFYLVIKHSLARPLADLTNVVSRIEFAAGPAGARALDYRHQDELGRLLAAMEKMQERVNTAQQVVIERNRQLAQALDAAESASRMKSAFLANTSHELRTPLNIVLGYAQLLAENAKLALDQREFARGINDSARRLLAIINGVIEISRLESAQTSLWPTRFDLPGFISRLRESLERPLERKKLTLNVTFAPSLPESVFSDETTLHCALLNLLSSVIGRHDGGTIDLAISARLEDPRKLIDFSVRDEALQVAAEDVDNLLEPFFNTRHGLPPAGETGLELALGRAYARALGGDLRVERDADLGVTFHLAVPAEFAAAKS
jgi:signal transduction histidine kinase